MLFTHLARLVAVIGFFIGAFRVYLGIATATGNMEQSSFARYTTASSPGEAIDVGLIVILLAIALGTLAEISFSVRKAST